VDRAFEIAWFFKIDPAQVFALTLDRFELYSSQAERIAELTNKT
jgi:hypothetical protein